MGPVSIDSDMVEVVADLGANIRLPWDFHPALTEERLRFCARLLANARRDAVAVAAYEMGDDTGRWDAAPTRSGNSG